MSKNYNLTLQSNNTDLQAILNTINELPETVEQVAPTISVNGANGLITATAGAKTSTYQLAFQAAKTITPTTASQIAVSSGYYTGGNITVNGDSNLVAGNIKSGVSIFGVSGTYAGSGGDTDTEASLIMHTVSGTYTNDKATTIGSYAFYSCNRLTTVSFPKVTSIAASAFRYCFSLTTVSFPMCTTIENDAFNQCSKLTTANFPKLTSIGSSAFRQCHYLTTASLPMCTTIASEAFTHCSRLTSLYLMGSSVCRLLKSGTLSPTPIAGISNYAGTYGSIYVPTSLLTSYKTATNWTYFSSRFVGI
jgi:hypothetical protein